MRIALLLVLVVGCKKHEPAPDKEARPAVAATDPCAKAKPEGVLAWIVDDYPAALACAEQRNVPVVLDLWAPWCHTCLSMKATVFTDKSFAADAPKFVFASIDTDREANAPIVAKFPLSAWPTFYVVGSDEAVLARFVGAASVAQFHAFLDAGARARSGGAIGADVHLLAAERATAAKDVATAERELEAALAAAPPAWQRRPDVLVSLINAKRKRKDSAGCVELAERSLDDTGNAASATDFLAIAIGCAEQLEKDAGKDGSSADPTPAAKAAGSGSGADPARAATLNRVKKLRERAAARYTKLVEDTSAPLSVDDRSDAMALLRETLIALDRKDDARALAEKQRALLDAAFAASKAPMEAMTYIWPLAEVYVYLDKPLELVPRLEKLAADLPGEYDPRARLGWVLSNAGKLDEAAKWTDAALALVYGPRKARVLTQRADIAHKQGDKAAERRYREDVVKTLEALPPGHAPADALERAKKALAELDAPPPPPT